MIRDAPYPPAYKVYCTYCGFESRHWTEEQADVMAHVHRKYGGHADTVAIDVNQNPRWEP